jgi:hypothetical protein
MYGAHPPVLTSTNTRPTSLQVSCPNHLIVVASRLRARVQSANVSIKLREDRVAALNGMDASPAVLLERENTAAELPLLKAKLAAAEAAYAARVGTCELHFNMRRDAGGRWSVSDNGTFVHTCPESSRGPGDKKELSKMRQSTISVFCDASKGIDEANTAKTGMGTVTKKSILHAGLASAGIDPASVSHGKGVRASGDAMEVHSCSDQLTALQRLPAIQSAVSMCACVGISMAPPIPH